MMKDCFWSFALSALLITGATQSVSPALSQSNTAKKVNQAFSESSTDISNLLNAGSRGDALFPSDPLNSMHQSWDKATKTIYETTGLDFGIDYTLLYQHASTVLPGTHNDAAGGDLDFYARWDLVDRDGPWIGALYFGTEVRHPYADISPAQLRQSVGSVLGTIDGFGKQDFLLTNLFWRQGSKEAGFMYQIGRMSPDGLISVSRYNNPNTNFSPTGLVGALTIAFPSQGFGAAAIAYPSESTYVMGVVTDANGLKTDFGALDRGEFFKAVELGFKPNFGGPYEGRHTLTFWHVDERSQTDVPSGHGIAVKLEQDLDSAGKMTGILRASKSFGSASFLKEQASIYLVLQDLQFKHDMLGMAAGWGNPANPALRDEYINEIFYRFPLTPYIDLTTSMQFIINPAANPTDDFSAVGGLRVRTIF